MTEPRYIQRDAQGKVLGHYANPQPYAQEQVAPDHPDIIQWDADRKAATAAYLARKAETNPEVLLARIAALEARVR